MKQLKLLSIFVFILFSFLIFFIFPLKTNAQSSEEVIIDAIFINNEQVVLDNKKCNLELKYDDVVKLAGRAPKDTTVSITFANEKYTGISDEMGNWMILFSIPNIDDGEYGIVQEGSDESYCEVTLSSTNTDKIEEVQEEEKENDNKVVYIVVLLVVLFLLLGSFIFLSKRKKDKI
jgi:hypothetical protein